MRIPPILRPLLSIGYAYGRALRAGRRLPPGPLIRLDDAERNNRHFLLEHARTVGPVFRGLARRKFWVYLVGLPLCRRFLREHGEHLGPVTLDLEGLFPHGFMRQMQGSIHQHYRQTLGRAIRPEDLADHLQEFARVAGVRLAACHQRGADGIPAPGAYEATLEHIATSLLIRVFFGFPAGSALHEDLLAAFHQLGPHQLVWTIGPPQRTQFERIRRLVAAPEGGEGTARCIAGRIHGRGQMDDTLLGNLIYMVEMGRHDLRALFRWLTWHGAHHPDLMEDIADEPPDLLPPKPSQAERFVQELLRTDQSERLVRRARRDIVFDDWMIPRHTMVRLCIWESHQAPGPFPDPCRFDPGRFQGTTFTADQFAPFGLDQHRCPLADLSVRAGMTFLRALSRGYTLETLSDGPPVRGPYHWEPSAAFSFRMRPRSLMRNRTSGRDHAAAGGPDPRRA